MANHQAQFSPAHHARMAGLLYLAIIVFGVHCILLGYLIVRSLFIPKAVGVLMIAGGVTYLLGSYTRFLLPEYVESVSPIYVVALVSELALCLWLLVKGVDPTRWMERVQWAR